MSGSKAIDIIEALKSTILNGGFDVSKPLPSAVALMRRIEAGVQASMSYCINRAVSISSDPSHPPYKFRETCRRAFGADVLDNPPPSFAALETAPVTQNKVVDVDGIDDAVRERF